MTNGLALFQGEVCLTVFENEFSQVFYTEQSHYVYKKDEEKVYELTPDSWTRLVLQLESLINY